ncbi:radical SAM protein [Desulfurobacterium thermolithotrophum]|uniref:radical SAM protein n=1 Tax=Desulfurobacterium thermolithotrophum TaxID=64160 RepID=UPI0013D0BF60|nr:radical SAM protein [Desulfurobacterium thermolithotrophum]
MTEIILIEECNHLQFKKGDFKVCLVYPGEAKIGLSSLAIHRVYSILNSVEGVSCDLFFEDTKSSFFLEKNLKEFDVIAFSITYEDHLFEVASILYKEGIPPLRKEREGKEFPVILGGGIGLFYNPAPFMPLFDVIYLGEAEGRLEEVIKKLAESNKKIEELNAFDNIILSREYRFHYNGEFVEKIEGERKKIFRSPFFSTTYSHSCFLSGDITFKDMYLIEVNRGCIEKCRFCVATYMGLPYREKKIEVLEREIEIAKRYGNRVGLIGAGVTDYSKMEELFEILKKYNVKASFSSLKVSSPSPYIFKIVEESQQKTVTLAPETGNESLRYAINKKVPDEKYFSFAERALEHGAENIKLYFLIGLPGETTDDLMGIVEMAKRFRELALKFWKARGKVGKIHLSVNPIISKPFTPFQWYGLNPKSEIEKKIRLLKREVGKIPNVEISYENIKRTILQAVICRGDTRIGEAAIESAVHGVNFRKSLKEKRLKIDNLYTREREKDELFPWEVVDSGIKREYLWREYCNTYKRKATPHCFPGCKACGLCD